MGQVMSPVLALPFLFLMEKVVSFVLVCVVVFDFLVELAMRLEDVCRPSTPSVEWSLLFVFMIQRLHSNAFATISTFNK